MVIRHNWFYLCFSVFSGTAGGALGGICGPTINLWVIMRGPTFEWADQGALLGALTGALVGFACWWATWDQKGRWLGVLASALVAFVVATVAAYHETADLMR